ncbi:transcriptional regulator, BadM/Rrf2 family [Marinospirillum celere]|uniref:Transcriptional regulator, BadM/Rrf2 family n=1 Tax=Marinospirillum celere TaxID=1122252 RepID=A0A1I1HCZ6_9GAMM|nr:SUF system Fe-S cluster assembly regulator [Marinospirillum celere]SFC21575.1 transcriptional regulator, BadM/Rrf2 family [Marinospirillum celere]
MLKLSKMTDYAVVLSAQMARHPERLYTAADLADEIGLPKPTVSKLLKMLVKAELLVSRRGTQGGYQLARPASAITASDLISAIEGPVAMTECSLEDSQCDLISQCGVATNWQRVTQAIHELLASVTLAQLAQTQPIKLPWVQIQTITLHEAG